MIELFTRISELPFWSKFVNMHGLLGMISLTLFGGAIVLYFLTGKVKFSISWLKAVLLILFLDLVFLDLAGLLVYIPYRATGGPRTALLSSPDTAWLHNIVFEHKEFLAFAPPILIFCALFIVFKLDSLFSDTDNSFLRYAAFAAILLSLLFVLMVAGEAVLVTKAAGV